MFDRARVVELRAAGWSWRQMAAAPAVSGRIVRRVYEQGVAKRSSPETGFSDAVKRVTSCGFAPFRVVPRFVAHRFFATPAHFR